MSPIRIVLLLVVTAGVVDSLRLEKWPDTDAPKHREAVVVVMKELKWGCHFNRLLALAKSSTTKNMIRDFWILLDKNYLVLDQSMINTLNSAGIKFEAQSDVSNTKAYDSFTDFHSGPSKSYFVQWASTKPEYDFVWHLEEDVFYTGKWGELFDARRGHNSTSDIIAQYWPQSEKWAQQYPGHNSTCVVDSKPCVLMQLLWPVVRFSHKFVIELKAALESNHTKTEGHHEALTGAFCASLSWCSMTKLPNLGVYTSFGHGHFTQKEQMSLEYIAGKKPPYNVQQSSLYHPVKCEAGEQAGDQALKYADGSSALSLQNNPNGKAQKLQLTNNAVVHGMAFDGTDWMSVGLERPNLVAETQWKPADACNIPPPQGHQFYSQRSEDHDLYNNYFCNKRGGTFVEMGALDGVRYSNTKFFDDSMGWSGALIEAAPPSVQLLKTNRNNSTNRIFAEGVCPEGQNTMDFMIGHDPATNGSPDDMADVFKTKWHDDGKTVTVPCRPLGSMLKEFLSHSGADHIDFFSLDVEGGELAVMSTFTFDVPVHVWIIEMDGTNPEKDESVRQLLQKHGYVQSDKTRKFKSAWANEIWVQPDAIA